MLEFRIKIEIYSSVGTELVACVYQMMIEFDHFFISSYQ